MRILVTGANGQLGRALAERSTAKPANGLSFIFADRNQLDLTRPHTYASVIETAAADVVINAAAYTAVDLAEDETDKAMAINAAAVGRLADVMTARGGRIVQVSTDYVFDGSKATPYTEIDPINPQTAYGRSKAAGEMRVREAGGNHVIVRTAWVYSPFGQNFVKTMLRLAGERETLSVVSDQLGNPTSALDLADGLIAMCRYWLDAPAMGAGQTFHLAGSGEADWATLARETFAANAAFSGPTATVEDIPSSAYPTKAKRPMNSRLDCGLFRETFGYRAPDWRHSVRDVVKRLVV